MLPCVLILAILAGFVAPAATPFVEPYKMEDIYTSTATQTNICLRYITKRSYWNIPSGYYRSDKAYGYADQVCHGPVYNQWWQDMWYPNGALFKEEYDENLLNVIYYQFVTNPVCQFPTFAAYHGGKSGINCGNNTVITRTINSQYCVRVTGDSTHQYVVKVHVTANQRNVCTLADLGALSYPELRVNDLQTLDDQGNFTVLLVGNNSFSVFEISAPAYDLISWTAAFVSMDGPF